jgi:group I intron endonuclease
MNGPIWSGSTTDVPDSILGLKNVIYKLTSPNDKSYVGQAFDFRRRFVEYKNLQKSRIGPAFQNALIKYDFENFRLSIIAVFKTTSLLSVAEILAIWGEKTLAPNGYNLTSGGDGLQNPSEETRSKMSASHIGKNHTVETRMKMSTSRKGVKRSSETCAKMSAALKGKAGHKQSIETRAKISAAIVGKPRSAETRAKISASKIGKKPTAETCAKISASKIGKKPAMETRSKMSSSRQRSSIDIERPLYVTLFKRVGREHGVRVEKPGHKTKTFGSDAPIEDRIKMAIAHLNSLNALDI